MLKEIRCDKFTNNIPNKTVYFQKGLNCVVGADDALNSIGKSSFLMIVDFCFGGNSYGDKESDVRENVGDHSVFFAFEFDGIEYHFRRDTSDPGHYFECDASYNSIGEKKPIGELCSFLKDQYFGTSATKSFRALVEGFSRVYGKDNYDVKKPLKTYKNDSQDENGIGVLIDLFGKSSVVAESFKKVSEAKSAKKAMDAAQKYNIVYSPIKTASSLEAAKEEIKRLQSEIDSLIKSQNQASIAIDETLSQKDIDLKSEQICLFRERKSLSIQLKTMQDMTGDSLLMSEEDRLKISSLFPEINLRSLEEIDEFQRRLSQNVNQEVNSQKEELSKRINDIQKRLDEINEALASNNVSPRIPKSFLDTLFNKKNEIKTLEGQISLYEKAKSMKENVGNISQQLNQDYGYVLNEIEKAINKKLEELNDDIYQEKRLPPSISLTSFTSYSYKTPKDKGTGTEYKSLVIFDLAILELTSLPFIIDDSFLFKNIWDEPVEGLFRIYSKSTKQIFIATDRTQVYSAEIQKIINEHEVVKLGNDDKALFGFTWSKVK